MTRLLIHTHAPERHVAKLTEAFPDVQIETCTKNSELPVTLERFAPDVMFTVNITSDAPYPRDAVLSSSLKWISVGGSGTDHITPWDTNEVTVTNSAGVAADVMAEYILGAFLYFNMDVPGLVRDKADRHWDKDRMMIPLTGATLLIVGLGQTGQALAAKAKAFGMSVIGTRASGRSTPNCDEVHQPDRLAQLWPRADYIAICTPRLPSTLGLVDDSAFALMKADAVLANVARGGVVMEPALIAALTSQRLRGAAMDVFATEPLPQDDPIWNTPNLLISPHSSGVYQGWEDASVTRFAANLGRYLAGEALTNIVDPTRGY